MTNAQQIIDNATTEQMVVGTKVYSTIHGDSVVSMNGWKYFDQMDFEKAEETFGFAGFKYKTVVSRATAKAIKAHYGSIRRNGATSDEANMAVYKIKCAILRTEPVAE